MSSETLSESDAAFYSFFCVMMCMYIVPAVIFSVYKLWRQPKQAFSLFFTVHVILLSVIMCTAWNFMQKLQNIDLSGVFDPYEILSVSDASSLSEIKKAYRKLSKRYHPDKNLNNPAATARFARIVKAYEALTDPIGIENYRKYGHPDGKQSYLMDIAFFSQSSSGFGDSVLFVVVYFGAIIGFIAWIVFYVLRSGRRTDKSHVSKKTLEKFMDLFNEHLTFDDILEFLLSSDELTFVEEDELREIQQRDKAHSKILKKMAASRAFSSKILNRIKEQANPVARENLIAVYLFLYRSKLSDVSQPTWATSRVNVMRLDLPYLADVFAQIVAKESVRRGYSSKVLQHMLGILSAVAQGSINGDPKALSRQQSRLPRGAKLPEICLDNLELYVADESKIRPGDWITIKFNLRRLHIQPGESAPLATTLYEQLDESFSFRQEHLWTIILDRDNDRLYSAWKVCDLSQSVQQCAIFEGPGISGNYQFEVRVVCPAYLNVQATATVPVIVTSDNVDSR